MRLVALIALALAALGRPALAETVDLKLVLLADVSRSITDEEFRLQRNGYAQAMTDPRVLKAITSGPYRSIAVTFIEFAGGVDQKVVVDWTVLREDETSASAMAEAILTAPRSFYGWTGIGNAIDFATKRLQETDIQSERSAIDVSGDGTNNSGRDIISARDDAIAQGIVVNGLAIINNHPTTFNPEHTHPPGGLPEYYKQNVVGGPGAFLMVVEDFDTFGEAITKKLVSEIAYYARPSTHAARQED